MQYALGIVVIFGLVIAGLVGCGMNIYKDLMLDWEAPYRSEAVRTIGIFVPPAGAIIGYLNFEEEKQ